MVDVARLLGPPGHLTLTNAAVNTINVPMLLKVQENIVRRAAMCIEVGGKISNSYYKI
jgi:hypothetical protein